MRSKERDFWVASVLQLNPEVPLLLEVSDFSRVVLGEVSEEEEVLTRGDRDQFPMVEVVILEEDLEVIYSVLLL